MNLNWYKSLEWYRKNKKVKKVLFVCTANACRSPAAEYYFNNMTHWWSGVSAFSRGTEVNKIMAELKSRGINLKKMMIEKESKKVIGDRTSVFIAQHSSKQITSKDVLRADLVLTMEKSVRDKLRGEYPDAAYKIFTLKGFIMQADNLSEGLDIGNPFIPPPIRKKEGIIEGNIGYYRYLQNYAKIFKDVEMCTRRLIEIIYLINSEKR